MTPRGSSDSLGPLHGVAVAVKDIVDVAGLATRCGSSAYRDTPAVADAVIVTRLRESGAAVFAKTGADELACGVYSPPTSNPWKLDRIPGGSSGGSGAAVAAGMTLMALGSDTGGSIRIPASLCGVAGMTPTYGLVPKSGVTVLSWSLDHSWPPRTNCCADSRSSARRCNRVADCSSVRTDDRVAPPSATDPGRLSGYRWHGKLT